ncbi:hypothetical protein BH11BAC2_BH11BAC2_10400 [soil metagenome]
MVKHPINTADATLYSSQVIIDPNIARAKLSLVIVGYDMIFLLSYHII